MPPVILGNSEGCKSKRLSVRTSKSHIWCTTRKCFGATAILNTHERHQSQHLTSNHRILCRQHTHTASNKIITEFTNMQYELNLV